ncbi:hypothetical protein LTR28_009028, partial [Elasticomyces elasticus]
MLMFFARTQREHGWKSPKYRFTRRQREAWEALLEQAERKANGEDDECDEGVSTEESDDENSDDEDDEDDGDDEDEEDGEDGKDGDDNHHGNNEEKVADEQQEPERLTKIQKACLKFCIEVLNQSITRKEYDSAL